jgi:Transcription factor WhiB
MLPTPRPRFTTWHEQAVCRGDSDPDAWFADSDSTNGTRAARDTRARRIDYALGVCSACPVAAACLDEALAVETRTTVYGVRGGLTARQRRRILPPGRCAECGQPADHHAALCSDACRQARRAVTHRRYYEREKIA